MNLNNYNALDVIIYHIIITVYMIFILYETINKNLIQSEGKNFFLSGLLIVIQELIIPKIIP